MAIVPLHNTNVIAKPLGYFVDRGTGASVERGECAPAIVKRHTNILTAQIVIEFPFKIVPVPVAATDTFLWVEHVR